MVAMSCVLAGRCEACAPFEYIEVMEAAELLRCAWTGCWGKPKSALESELIAIVNGLGKGRHERKVRREAGARGVEIGQDGGIGRGGAWANSGHLMDRYSKPGARKGRDRAGQRRP